MSSFEKFDVSSWCLYLILFMGLIGSIFCAEEGGSLYTKKFRIGPMNVGTGHEQFVFPDIARPQGIVAILNNRLALENSEGEELPIEVVYPHHMVLLEETDEGDGVITIANGTDDIPPLKATAHPACSGAESAKSPMKFPRGFSYVTNGRPWTAVIETMGLWQVVAKANMSVWLAYSLTWSDDIHTIVPIQLLRLSATPSVLVNVPGDGEPGSVYSWSQVYRFPVDLMIAYTVGHFHIGTVNITIGVQEDDQVQLLCTSIPTYDNFNFVTAISHCHPLKVVKKGTPVIVTVHYDNTKPYEDAMGFVMTYVTASIEAAVAKAEEYADGSGSDDSNSLSGSNPKSSKTLVIVVSSVAGVIGAIVASLTVAFIIKKKKSRRHKYGHVMLESYDNDEEW